MTEFEIAEIIESDLAAYNLVLQVSQQNESLLITLIRPLYSNLSYTALTKAIAARIKTLQLPGINTQLQYSRFLGEYDLDWQTRLELIIRKALGVYNVLTGYLLMCAHSDYVSDAVNLVVNLIMPVNSLNCY